MGVISNKNTNFGTLFAITENYFTNNQ